MDLTDPIEQYELELEIEAGLGLRSLEPPRRTVLDRLNRSLKASGPTGALLLERWPQSLRQQFEQIARYEEATPKGEDHAQLATLLLQRTEEVVRSLLLPRSEERELLRPLLKHLEDDRAAWLSYFLGKPSARPTMAVSEAILAALPNADACPYLTKLRDRLHPVVQYLERPLADGFRELRERRNGVSHAREECTHIEYRGLVNLSLGTQTVGQWLGGGGQPPAVAAVLHLMFLGAGP